MAATRRVIRLTIPLLSLLLLLLLLCVGPSLTSSTDDAGWLAHVLLLLLIYVQLSKVFHELQ